MYNPKTNYNTNSSFNKYKGTYFNNDVDISGGNIILRSNGTNLYMGSNSNIYSLNNRIQFNDISNNIYFYSPLKMNYNNIEYDIGNQLGKIQDLNNKIGPMNFLNNSNIFYNNIDISSGNINIRNGNLYLSPNSSIYTPNNQIQFNEEFQFCDFINNVNVLGQLKNTYNSIEYDVGLQCEKTDQIISTVGTLSPIVYDTAFKCTNFYYDQASNSTVWSGLLTCPISSIASTAIANTTRFIEGTGNQNIGGIKRFTSNIRIDAGMQLSAGTITLTNANLQKIALILTLSSDIQTQINTTNSNVTTLQNNSVSLSALNTFSGATNTFTNNIRHDGSLLLNAGALTITNANLQKLQYISTVSSDIQTQLNTTNSNVTTLQNNSVSLSALNTFSGATNTFTNNIRHDGSLLLNAGALTITNANLQKLQYLSDITSNVNTSISNLNTKTTKMSYMSVGGINTTTILDGLISQTFSFTSTINNINTTTFGYISGLTSSAQSQISNLAAKLTAISYESSNTTTTIANSLLFTGSLNSISATTFGYLSGLTAAIQDQLNSLSTRIGTFELVGSIIMSPLSDIQTTSGNKYLICDGGLYNRTVYASLFAKIGTNFGAGDGLTTFAVPNYQGAFLRGYGQAMVNGQIYEGNFTTNTPQQDAIQEHRHAAQPGGYCGSNRVTQSGGFFNGTSYPQVYSFDQTGIQSTGRSDPGETRPFNYSIYYYIRT